MIDPGPLVDHHCHSVLAGEADAATVGSLLTEAPSGDGWDSLLGLAVRRECAPVLDLPAHAPPAQYLARRAELGAAEVTRSMLAAAGTATLLVDHGLRAGDLLGLDALAAAAAAPVREIVRLETVAEEIGPSAGFPGAFAAELARRTATAVACKSVLAYRHGLDVDPRRPAPAEIAAAVQRWDGGRLTDPVLLRHLLWCGIDTGLPLQLHTGFGDPDEDLHRANPVLLSAFCRATVDTGAPVVLLHCYPYHREAAWLAHVFPHVYLDVGLASTYVGFRASTLLAEALELAPFGKLLYSSDAFGLPELYLVAARAFRRAVDRVLGGWVRSGEAAEPDVRRIATMIASGNARTLYGLST